MPDISFSHPVEARPGPPDNGVSAAEDIARTEALALRRASELLTDVLHDVRRRLALEGASAAKGPEQQRKTRGEPMPYVDLAMYDGMADRDVLLALGARRGEISYYKPALQREQARRSSFLVDDTRRCEAGIASQLGLRCTRTSLDNEKWCQRHHPNPPVGAQNAADRGRDRLRREQLWQRPDGRVLEALYDLTSGVQELTDVARDSLDRARHLEKTVADKSAAWLSAKEAVTYTRRSPRVVARAAGAGELSGVREGQRGSWSFRPADLDTWLEKGRNTRGRFPRAQAATGRRTPRVR
jgi:hypothetical protein